MACVAHKAIVVNMDGEGAPDENEGGQGDDPAPHDPLPQIVEQPDTLQEEDGAEDTHADTAEESEEVSSRRLEDGKLKAGGGKRAIRECTVCHELLGGEKREMVVLVPCGHCVHAECWGEWTETCDRNGSEHRCTVCNDECRVISRLTEETCCGLCQQQVLQSSTKSIVVVDLSLRFFHEHCLSALRQTKASANESTFTLFRHDIQIGKSYRLYVHEDNAAASTPHQNFSSVVFELVQELLQAPTAEEAIRLLYSLRGLTPSNWTKDFESLDGRDGRNVAVLRQAGTIQSTVKTIERFSSESTNVFLQGCFLLADLCFGSYEGSVVLIDSGGLETMFLNPTGDEGYQSEVLHTVVLDAFLPKAPEEPHIVKAGGIESVLQSMKKHLAASKVQKRAASFLRRCARYQNRIAASDGKSALKQAIEKHRKNELVQREAHHALMTLDLS